MAAIAVHNSCVIRNVDPRALRNPNSRTEVDPFKLAADFREHGRAPHEMRPILVNIINGELVIMDGVTLAAWAIICRQTVPIVIQQ